MQPHGVDIVRQTAEIIVFLFFKHFHNFFRDKELCPYEGIHAPTCTKRSLKEEQCTNNVRNPKQRDKQLNFENNKKQS